MMDASFDLKLIHTQFAGYPSKKVNYFFLRSLDRFEEMQSILLARLNILDANAAIGHFRYGDEEGYLITVNDKFTHVVLTTMLLRLAANISIMPDVLVGSALTTQLDPVAVARQSFAKSSKAVLRQPASSNHASPNIYMPFRTGNSSNHASPNMHLPFTHGNSSTNSSPQMLGLGGGVPASNHASPSTHVLSSSLQTSPMSHVQNALMKYNMRSTHTSPNMHMPFGSASSTNESPFAQVHNIVMQDSSSQITQDEDFPLHGDASIPERSALFASDADLEPTHPGFRNLRDYKLELLRLEQQNKKGLLMKSQEQGIDGLHHRTAAITLSDYQRLLLMQQQQQQVSRLEQIQGRDANDQEKQVADATLQEQQHGKQLPEGQPNMPDNWSLEFATLADESLENFDFDLFLYAGPGVALDFNPSHIAADEPQLTEEDEMEPVTKELENEANTSALSIKSPPGTSSPFDLTKFFLDSPLLTPGVSYRANETTGRSAIQTNEDSLMYIYSYSSIIHRWLRTYVRKGGTGDTVNRYFPSDTAKQPIGPNFVSIRFLEKLGLGDILHGIRGKRILLKVSHDHDHDGPPCYIECEAVPIGPHAFGDKPPPWAGHRCDLMLNDISDRYLLDSNDAAVPPAANAVWPWIKPESPVTGTALGEAVPNTSVAEKEGSSSSQQRSLTQED